MTIEEMNETLERDGSEFRLEEKNGMTFATKGFFKFATDFTCLKLAKLPPGDMLQLEFEAIVKNSSKGAICG